MSAIFTVCCIRFYKPHLSTSSDCHASMIIYMLFALHVQAYANNQHKIADEMLTNPFLKAMSICEGTVSILDAGCVVYSRIWCIFELFKSVMGDNSNYEFDIYTDIDRDRRAVGITHGYSLSDDGSPRLKKNRESKFPLDRILLATNVDIKQAQASVESDRKLILNTITGRSVDVPVVDDHDKYDELNNILRGFFVTPALQRIIKEMDVDTITRCLEIVKASNARIIHLDLEVCSRFDDVILIRLADSLPLTLTEFSLWSRGSSVTVNGMNACLEKILECPQLVMLDLSYNNIDLVRSRLNAVAANGMNVSLGQILRCPQLKVSHSISLKTLNLVWNNIGDVGAKTIANAMKGNRSLVELQMMDNNIGDVGAKAIADALKDIHSLKHLGLSSNKIGNDGAKAIADALKGNHSLKSLHFFRNKVKAPSFFRKLKAFGWWVGFDISDC